MKHLFSKALIVAAALGTLMPTAFARDSQDVSGKWKVEADSAFGRKICNIDLRDTEMFGAYSASSFGCSGDLFSVHKWQVRGRGVVLMDAGQNTLATLRLRDDELLGRDKSGKRVRMWRAGSRKGTSVPQARRDKAWGRNDDRCIYNPRERSCASRRDLRAPRPGDHIGITTLSNLRARPRPDARVVGTLRADSCPVVNECRRENGVLWCKVGTFGHDGYIRQTFQRSGRTLLLFAPGCS